MNPPIESALAALPHGPEFRFLDRLLVLKPGESGTGEYRVRGDEPFLRGHFPGRPLFPGVLMVEAAAQLAGTVAQSAPNLAPLPDLRLTGMRRIKILGTVGPGSVLRIEARVTGRLANLVQAEVSVRHAEVLLLTGEVTLSGAADPNAALTPH